MRNIQSLTPLEVEKILDDAPNRCYRLIAADFDIPINTVKKVVRLKRYQHASLPKSKTGDDFNERIRI